jgi:hypothetical protein
MTTKNCGGVSGILVGFCLFAMAANGQTTVGELRGNVTDASGAAVAAAVVSVQNVDTNDVRKSATDPQGNYIFAQLPVGRYNLTVEALAFQKFVMRDIALQVDARRREDVSLKVGEVTQEVTVAASAVAVNSTNATIGEVIDQKPIVELPLTALEVTTDGKRLIRTVALST